MDNKKTICIVGAGVIGLSTAVNIITTIPDVNVTLMAEEFSPDTTGDVAAGFWKPHAIGLTPEKDVLKWGRLTWDYLMDIVSSSDGPLAGVQLISGYHMFSTHTPERTFRYIHPRFTDMTFAEMNLYGRDCLSGLFFTSIINDCKIYLPWLLKRFKEKGGSVIKRKLQSLQEIYWQYDVIVNCSGAGAYKLASDNDMQPVRGQIVRVKAPWVKHFYISEDEIDDTYKFTYIFPRINDVVLGGTHDENTWDTVPSDKDRQSILERCCKILPGLKNAEILGDDCGLRPYRKKGVRLETEPITIKRTDKQRTAFIVHNYGHGGSGITVHWGCALDATEKVKNCLKLTYIPAKL